MSPTLLSAHSDVSDFMMVVGSRRRCQYHYVDDFKNVKNRSPTSQKCHRHKPSPTIVTDIVAADRILFRFAERGNGRSLW